MAASVVSLLLLLVLAAGAPSALSQSAAPPAPAGPLNLTAILAKGGQYTAFIRLLQQTRVDEQINSQLNNSFNGMTVFAPTDNAFSALPAGTLNGLTQQEQIQLVLFHVLPRFYSTSTFQTVSNPIPTQASGKSGVFTLNITAAATSSTQANVTTGVDSTPVNTPLYSDFPLAVYSVEKVLLPYELFGPKPPEAAPTPSAKKPSGGSTDASGDAGSANAASAPEGQGSGASGRAEAGWSFLAAGVGLLAALQQCM